MVWGCVWVGAVGVGLVGEGFIWVYWGGHGRGDVVGVGRANWLGKRG